MPLNILLADDFSSDFPLELGKVGKILGNRDAVEEADVIIVRGATKVRGEYLERAKNLKLVIRGGVGLDNVDLDACRDRGIAVHNTPDASSIAVAELVMAGLLGLLRKIPQAHTSTLEARWEKKKLIGTELYGRTLGLWGFGRIGQEVARRCRAFGMAIIFTDIVRYPEAEAELGAEFVELDDLLSRSDVLSLHLPLLPATAGIVSAEKLQQMKNGTILVNMARGGLVDEDAVSSSLKGGKLLGLVTDVYAVEPPSREHPYFIRDNVLLTPHIGAQTRECQKRIEAEIVTRIASFEDN